VSEEPSKSDRTAIFTLAGVIAAATIAFIGAQWSARTAFDAQMVQIGVAILSADPSKSDVTPARQWALDLVEEHSGKKFSPVDRDTLLHHPIKWVGPTASWELSELLRVDCSHYLRNADGSWDASVGWTTIKPGTAMAERLERDCKD
jgi:hypothetical protein